MVTKNQNKTSGQEQRTGKIKSLKLKKLTVRDLSAEQSSQVKGGTMGQPTHIK
jgi:hypothetical protein